MGNFKLSQNKSPEDRAGVKTVFRAQGDEHKLALAEMIEREEADG